MHAQQAQKSHNGACSILRGNSAIVVNTRVNEDSDNATRDVSSEAPLTGPQTYTRRQKSLLQQFQHLVCDEQYEIVLQGGISEEEEALLDRLGLHRCSLCLDSCPLFGAMILHLQIAHHGNPLSQQRMCMKSGCGVLLPTESGLAGFALCLALTLCTSALDTSCFWHKQRLITQAGWLAERRMNGRRCGAGNGPPLSCRGGPCLTLMCATVTSGCTRSCCRRQRAWWGPSMSTSTSWRRQVLPASC